MVLTNTKVDIKEAVKNKKLYFNPRNRKKTLDFMLEHNLKAEDVCNIVSKLTIENFYEGPEDDDNGTPGYIMKLLNLRKLLNKEKLSSLQRTKIESTDIYKHTTTDWLNIDGLYNNLSDEEIENMEMKCSLKKLSVQEYIKNDVLKDLHKPYAIEINQCQDYQDGNEFENSLDRNIA